MQTGATPWWEDVARYGSNRSSVTEAGSPWLNPERFGPRAWKYTSFIDPGSSHSSGGNSSANSGLLTSLIAGLFGNQQTPPPLGGNGAAYADWNNYNDAYKKMAGAGGYGGGGGGGIFGNVQTPPPLGGNGAAYADWNNYNDAYKKMAGVGGYGGGGGGTGQTAGFNFLDAAGNRVGGVDLNSNTVQSPVQANQGALWSPAFASQARSDLMRPVAAGATPGAIPGVVGADAAQRIGVQYADMARSMANQSAAGLNMAGQAGEADYFGKAQAARGQSQLGGQQLLNSMYGAYSSDALSGAKLGLQQAGINQGNQVMGLNLLAKLYGMQLA